MPINGDDSSDFCVQNTLLFRRWEDMKKEILLHKWYESERAGHDIGWEKAMTDWMIRFGNQPARNASRKS